MKTAYTIPRLPIQHGFTFVELLAVISCISVLCLCLLTVMRKAIALGRQSACASNLKQLGIGLTNYGTDCHYRLPGPTVTGSSDNALWVMGIYGVAGAAWPEAIANNSWCGMGDTYRLRYFGAPELLFCPSAENGKETYLIYKNYFGVSNPLVWQYAKQLNPIRVTSYLYYPSYKSADGAIPLARQVATKALVGDCVYGFDWHGGYWNLLYPDMHVKAKYSKPAIDRDLARLNLFLNTGSWGSGSALNTDVTPVWNYLNP